jgi:hypothetical protein
MSLRGSVLFMFRLFFAFSFFGLLLRLASESPLQALCTWEGGSLVVCVGVWFVFFSSPFSFLPSFLSFSFGLGLRSVPVQSSLACG